MKKIVSLMLVCFLVIGAFSACGKSGSQTADKKSDTKTEQKSDDNIEIIATIFPEYDWVMNVLGDNPAGANVTMLLDKGVDMHSFQPTAEDILKISSCDMFIYVGGESDAWVEDALAEAVNQDKVVINLMDSLGAAVKEEEVVEGMQGDEEEEEEEEDEVEYDEHVWLSLRNADKCVDIIGRAMAQIDEKNAAIYESNAVAYRQKLDVLDENYKTCVAESPQATLLFGDRFPFRYLTDDYGINYYAAFVGCSAETEASFETITFLAKKVDELGLDAVMTIDGSDQKIAKTIVENTEDKDAKILTMDSMQSTTADDVKNGKTYLSTMEDNLTVLREALQ